MTTASTPTPEPRYNVDYSLLPEHMREGAKDYIERGYTPGGFLFSVLANDLVESFAHADATNLFMMSVWADWLVSEAPRNCWGSVAKVNAWLASYE